MRKTLLTALAAAAVLATAMPAHRAEAMTFSQPARADVVQQVVSVCGTHGCVQVQTKRVIHHQKPGNTVPHHI